MKQDAIYWQKKYEDEHQKALDLERVLKNRYEHEREYQDLCEKYTKLFGEYTHIRLLKDKMLKIINRSPTLSEVWKETKDK